jgi:hypothetical protein
MLLAPIRFDAPPTVAAFMKSASFGRLIAGPVGSGKTTGCIFELLRRALEQAPASDGYRYTRFAVVRQTLKQLKDTVLKDILSWLGTVAHYKVQDNVVIVEFADCKSEWLLLPLEDAEDQRRLLSMQLTGAWMSECIEMDVNLVAGIAGRCGRYPSGARGTPSWFGIIADTNMPSEGSDWHKFMDIDQPEDWEIYVQPGGLEEYAENLAHLTQTADTKVLDEDDPARLAQGRLYYERLARSNNIDWVKRYVHAQFGNDPSGTAVFRESFKSSFHAADGLIPNRFAPLVVGQDFGRDPWSIITQMDARGRLLVLEEIEAEDIGLEQHIQRSLRPVLMRPEYLGIPVIVIGDPSGTARSSIYEETTFDVLKREGLACLPAPTNDLAPRLRAVESWLLKQSDGKGALLVDRAKCPTIIRGLAGGYRYAKTRNGTRKPLPDKNKYSHPMDALQYACLVAHGQMNAVIGRALGHRRQVQRRKVTAAGWT